MTLQELGLKKRTLNVLRRGDCAWDPGLRYVVPDDVSQLSELSKYQVLKIKNFGRTALVDLEQRMAASGYSFNDRKVLSPVRRK